MEVVKVEGVKVEGIKVKGVKVNCLKDPNKVERNLKIRA